MRLFAWLFRAFVFFCLFAFALNNQHATAVHGFFGHAWTAPLVIVVLAAFSAGAVFGVLAMTPSWWRQRRLAKQALEAKPSESIVDPQRPDTPVPHPGIPDGI